MEPQDLYAKKRVTTQEALSYIHSGDTIVGGFYGCEPILLFRNLHTIADRVHDIKVWTGIAKEDYPFLVEDAYMKQFFINSFFYGSQTRKIHSSGRVTFFPFFLRDSAAGIIAHERPRVFAAAVPPMDEDGYFHLSPSLQIEYESFLAADVRILEVNPHVPRLYGPAKIHISDVTCVIEAGCEIFQIDEPKVTAVEQQIAEHVATLVQDGDTLQFGIGNTSNALSEALLQKHDLGIHTESLSTAMGKLMAKGAVNNSRKTLHPGKTICAFAWGSGDFYNYIDGRQDIVLLPAAYVNDPRTIAQNDNMVSINTAIQIDLTGQVCSESIGNRQYSGTGGATDFAEGAYLSKGGRSIIAITSTAKGGTVSRIQPFLSPGAAVSISRNLSDYIVTEYGIARMRGAGIRQRTQSLIAIAHPDFREELRRQAAEFLIW
ncbi:Acyl-CoA hydrolase [Oscillibacter sp. PC13]|uniref:acetyl-CoA hydrolase/transferase family protein n=1 Tax=Oscillibacter sp. PC13 TaxID=1855299 RepID=UPI0008EEF90F|nr:acetyl-CoA hydrolase/transferase C-terminal domain-containing protein [Oscillibacter sp. PC13]SFP91298.1 Acyl-CoA hydrolase [Oscillibacter sp. PC13]